MPFCHPFHQPLLCTCPAATHPSIETESLSAHASLGSDYLHRFTQPMLLPSPFDEAMASRPDKCNRWQAINNIRAEMVLRIVDWLAS